MAGHVDLSIPLSSGRPMERSALRQFLVHPFSRDLLDDRLFDGPYGLLRDLFAERGVQLTTTDRGSLASAERVLLFNYNPSFLARCAEAGVGRERLVLFAYEPPVVIREHGDPHIFERFSLIFTHDDRLVDKTRFHKLLYPQAKDLIVGPGNEHRRLLTVINTNKYSYARGELYSGRRRVIRWFERHEPEFDLYGHRWDERARLLTRTHLHDALASGKLLQLAYDAWDQRRPYSSYRGSVTNKYDVLQQYRFSVCFENQSDLPGYITEKLFDCLVCGTIPIYRGAPNIADYLPADCFIDMRHYRGLGQLAASLHALDRDAVSNFRSAGAAYIASPAFSQWKPPAVFANVVDVLS